MFEHSFFLSCLPFFFVLCCSAHNNCFSVVCALRLCPLQRAALLCRSVSPSQRGSHLAFLTLSLSFYLSLSEASILHPSHSVSLFLSPSFHASFLDPSRPSTFHHCCFFSLSLFSFISSLPSLARFLSFFFSFFFARCSRRARAACFALVAPSRHLLFCLSFFPCTLRCPLRVLVFSSSSSSLRGAFRPRSPPPLRSPLRSTEARLLPPIALDQRRCTPPSPLASAGGPKAPRAHS